MPPAGTANFRDQFESLYGDHHRWLVGWLCRKRVNPADAADLAHDTFLRVLGKPRELKGLQEPRAWLTVIARGLVIDLTRRRALERAYLEALAAWPQPEHPSPEARAVLIEALVRIDAMLDGLPARARAAFLLSRLDGLTHPQIAQRLGVSLSSVEKYLAAAWRHCLALYSRVDEVRA